MPAPIPKDHLIRAGRDAVIAHRFQGGPAPRCPYARQTRRRIFWDMGAKQAATLADKIEGIGA